MKHICVFCGSSPGQGKVYMQAARLLGKTLAEKQYTLVYGGASVGLMGQVARSCLDAGGEVIGVITRRLMNMEVAYTRLNDLQVVETMHERKARMAELADGFIALPGGLGTIEEFFEVVTWSQLGMHQKPCGLLNTGHYYDRLLDFLDTAVSEQFIGDIHRSMVLVDENPQNLLAKFESYEAPKVDKGAWARHLMEQAGGE
ncbi:MAG: TIGR00730 family Rossman fold protein [Leptolinea sp.]|jgi:uncharacterized protein (TIGR00730 family)|nr:TIGR00730 family Rossman fold protein [Leptolinea sp.]